MAYLWQVYKKEPCFLKEHRCYKCGKRVLETNFFGETICNQCADTETQERIRVKVQAQLIMYRKRR